MEEEGEYTFGSLAGEKRASHEVHAFESDWVWSDWTGYARIATRGTRTRERQRESAAMRGGGEGEGDGGFPGCVDGCRKECGGGGRGWFFPIKQPAEFVFSLKRRCRFKVIDCHREGGTDEMRGELN